MSWWALLMVASEIMSAGTHKAERKRLAGVEREDGVNFGRDTAGNDLEDLNTESYKQTVHGILGLLICASEKLSGYSPAGDWDQLTLPCPYRT